MLLAHFVQFKASLVSTPIILVANLAQLLNLLVVYHAGSPLHFPASASMWAIVKMIVNAG